MSNNSTVENGVIQLRFVCIDFWGRPVFKVANTRKHYFFSDVNHLFNTNTTEEEVKEFYKDMPFPLNEYITYHGRDFEDDPNGGAVEKELQIV